MPQSACKADDAVGGDGGRTVYISTQLKQFCDVSRLSGRH